MSFIPWYDENIGGSNFLGFWEDGYLKIPMTSLLFISFAVLIYRGITQLQVVPTSSTKHEKKLSLLRRQMTPIGRFALLSQTERNPSIVSFFIALGNKEGTKPIDMEEFGDLWTSRVMSKHERFNCRVSEENDKYFEVTNRSFDEHAEELPHPRNENEFKARISSFLTSPIDVNDRLWEAAISTGSPGASGAMIEGNDKYVSETVALFRSHHCLCDGVSLSTVIADSTDEADQLKKIVLDALDKRKKDAEKDGLFLAFTLTIAFFVYILGAIKALAIQLWNMITSSNPFDEFIKNAKDQSGKRSVAWKQLALVDDAKTLTKASPKKCTLNDMFISLLSSALEKQYLELGGSPKCQQSSVNIVIPVHLTGGVLPGHSIGNKIGAFVTRIPFEPFSKKTQKPSDSSILRLNRISDILRSAKSMPSPQLSWLITALISNFAPGETIAKHAMVRSNCHAVAVISNVRGFPFQVHWNGRPVENICPLLPLPPGIPIGIVVATYNGKILLSLDADSRIVPDADRFLGFMVEEFEEMKHVAA